jgi:glycosyltransferase involved in cell wall biosynthesis
MYATQKNISDHKPSIDHNAVCGRHLFYPNINTNDEGGMRLSNKFKQNLPNKPLISVITTVLNSDLFIEKAICSVLNQTYENIEYIIVDGASTDRTLDKITKYEDCIDYYFSEPYDGLYEGMNKGLSLASGEYILILNSDDWYAENCIDVLVESIQKSRAELVSALAIETDLYGRQIRKIPCTEFKDNTRLRMPLRHETMLISKDLYNRVGPYDEDYKIIADFKLTIKIYDQIESFYQVNKYLMYFRKIGIASEVTPQLINERKRLIGDQFPFLEENDLALLSNQLRTESNEYKNLLDKYKDQSKFIKTLNDFAGINV